MITVEHTARKPTRLQQLRSARSALAQRWREGERRWEEAQLLWRNEKKEINRQRRLVETELSRKAEREQRLKAVNYWESDLREKMAERIVWLALNGRRCPEAPELAAMRPQWEKGGTAESMARYNAFARSDDPAKWTTLAERCGLSVPAVTFTKAEVGKLLEYSLSGVERLMRVGRLRYETWGHQTVRFQPDEVRRFIKTVGKWHRTTQGK